MSRLIIVSLVVVSVVSTAWSQAPAPYYAPYGGAYGGYYSSSTVGESHSRGMAAIIRSSGLADLQRSEAVKNYEDARSKYFDNRLKGAHTYFELRDMNERHRAADREPPSEEQLRRINQARLPDRLSPSEVDPLTGEIEWPLVLQQKEFVLELTEIERLFAERARNEGELSGADYLALRRTAQQLREKLASQIELFPPEDYLRGKNFLDSLIYEVYLAKN